MKLEEEKEKRRKKDQISRTFIPSKDEWQQEHFDDNMYMYYCLFEKANFIQKIGTV